MLNGSAKILNGRANALERFLNVLAFGKKTLDKRSNVLGAGGKVQAASWRSVSIETKHRHGRMKFFDTPGLAYDSGAVFDDVAAVPLTINTTMAKVKFTLKNVPDVEAIQTCNNLKTALTGNANFPTPPVTLAAFGTAITTGQTKLTTAENAQATAKQATADKDLAIAAMAGMAMQIVGYVDTTANGDESKILSAGLSVRAGRSPVSAPSQVMNLSLTAGDDDGSLDVHWDAQDKVKSYEVQVSPDPFTTTSFVTKDTVTKSSVTLDSLTSGSKVWVRVRAINSKGKGAWSDPATKIVP
jgi:hypothetical protein